MVEVKPVSEKMDMFAPFIPKAEPRPARLGFAAMPSVAFEEKEPTSKSKSAKRAKSEAKTPTKTRMDTPMKSQSPSKSPKKSQSKSPAKKSAQV